MSFRKRYGPWALVTGASSGMGASFAKQLAEKGLNVVLVARREDRLRALSEALERSASVHTRVVSAELSSLPPSLRHSRESGNPVRVAQSVEWPGSAGPGEVDSPYHLS